MPVLLLDTIEAAPIPPDVPGRIHRAEDGLGVDGTVTLMVVSFLESDTQLGSRQCLQPGGILGMSMA